MVDIEPYLYSFVAEEMRKQYSWASKVGFSNDYVIQPEKFPWVTITEEDSRTEIKYHDTSNEENAARITLEVNVWSNHLTRRKQEARKIMKAVNDVLQRMGFRRTYLNNDPTQQDISIYKVYGRFTAIVEENEDGFLIYHRP